MRVDLTPDGNETDMVLGYAVPLGDGISFNSSATLSQDAENVKGLWATGAIAHVNVKF